MSIQKMHIRIPERITISNPFISRPLVPIPCPTQQRNNYRPQQFQSMAPQPIIQQQSTNVMGSNSPLQINNNFARMPHQIHANSPVHLNMNSQQGKQLMNINSRVFQQNPHNQMIPSSMQRQQSPTMRPASPKIQFKYASPAKPKNSIAQNRENSHSNSGQVLNSFNENQMRPPNQNAQENGYHKQMKPIQQFPSSKHSEQTIIKKIESEKRIQNSPVSFEARNSISNYIYMIDNDRDHVAQSQRQQLPPSHTALLSQQFQSSAPPIIQQTANKVQKQNQSSSVSLGNLLHNNLDNQATRKQKQRQTSKRESAHFLNQFETAKIQEGNNKNKSNDEQLKLMLEQYQHLRYENGDDQLPRVQKNSSDQNDDSQNANNTEQMKTEKQRRMNKTVHNDQNNRMEIKRINKGDQQKNLGKFGTFGHLPDQKSPMRIIDEQRFPENNSQNKNALNRGSIIREHDYFFIQGVENTNSQVFEGMNYLNDKNLIQKKSGKNVNFIKEQDQQQQYGIKQAEYQIRLKEKDLQIKNLKNQVWLMKLKQNQLLNTIKKLQNVNKDQSNIISGFINKRA